MFISPSRFGGRSAEPKVMRYWFALFLLLCDWTWDTHFGTDAFSFPMSSSLTVSQNDDDHSRHDTTDQHPTSLALSPSRLFGFRPAWRGFAAAEQFPHPSCAGHLCY